MVKTLFRKQMQSMVSSFYRSGGARTGRSKFRSAMFMLLMIYVGGVFFVMIMSMMKSLCGPLLDAGLGWLYFALAGLMGIILAVVGSVFMTQAALYEAKDNEFLLSMPIPPGKILFSRIISLYVQNFVLGNLSFLAAVIVYAMNAEMSAASLVLCILLFIVLPLLSLALNCILAWLTAMLTSRMRSKTMMTMILSLGFLGLYFYLYYRISYYLQLLIANSQQVGEGIRTALYPLYLAGRAAEGDVRSFAVFTLMTAAVFAAVYIALSRSFIGIATTKRGAARVRYREKQLHVRSVDRTLFGKELRRFFSSSVYMLNCGLGSVLMLAGAVLIIVKRGFVLSLTGQIPGAASFVDLVVCLAVCAVASPNAVSAPSISLEGSNLWILQSLPVDGSRILAAKLKLHVVVSAPAAVICGIAADIALAPPAAMSLLIPAVPCVYILLCGEIGLLLNLRLPKLSWINEATAVKQSMSVVVSILVNMGILVAAAALYYVLAMRAGMPDVIFLLLCALAMAAASGLLWHRLVTKGAEEIITLG